MKNNYEGSLAMANVFEKKLAEGEANLAKLIEAETNIAFQIEDTQRQILAMRRVLATLKPIMEEKAETKPEVEMPPAEIPNFLAAARAVDVRERAGENFLTDEETENALNEAYNRPQE